MPLPLIHEEGSCRKYAGEKHDAEGRKAIRPHGVAGALALGGDPLRAIAHRRKGKARRCCALLPLSLRTSVVTQVFGILPRFMYVQN